MRSKPDVRLFSAPLTALLIAFRSSGASLGLGICTAIYRSKLNIGGTVAAAVLPLGLNPGSLETFIGLVAGHNYASLAHIPGVTDEMIAAGSKAFSQAFLDAAKGIWYLVIASSTLGVIREYE